MDNVYGYLIIYGAGVLSSKYFQGLISKIKQIEQVDRMIDDLVSRAEDEFPDGELKHAFVKNELPELMKRKGISLLKRSAIKLFGGVSKSIVNSVLRKKGLK